MKVLSPALKFYSILLLVALGFIYYEQRLRLELFLNLEAEKLLWEVLLGLGTALLMILLSLYASRNFLWARLLDKEFRKILVPLSVWEIAAVALLSGVVEETLFRGAIQPAVGLIPASILFGLLHMIPRKAFLPWTVYAIFGGFVFGSVFELTQSLLPVILAHAVINFVLILLLNRSDNSTAAEEV